MNGQGCDPRILQSLGKVPDDHRIIVPSQAGLDRHGNMYRLNQAPCDLNHSPGIAQPAAACPPPGDLVLGAAKIDIYHIRGHFFRYAGCLEEHLRNVPVDLNSYWSFTVRYQ